MRAAARVPIPGDVERDIQRVFALIRERVALEPYPPGYRIGIRWRGMLQAALARAGRRPRAWRLAYLSLGLFDLELAELSADVKAMLMQRRREFNLKHPELRPLRESAICAENTTVLVEGGTHSNKMDQAFSYYDDIYSGIPKTERLQTIVEIGSGYGRIARLMKLIDDHRCFMLVDLPESLAFAYAFLAANFPEAKMVFISSQVDAKAVAPATFDFVFCPIQFIEQVRWPAIDLLINTYSLAEMPQESVDYLMSCVHRHLRPRFFYSLNMAFSDKDLHVDTGGADGEANQTVLNLQPEWRIRHFDLHAAIVAGCYRFTASAVLERLPNSQHAIERAVADASSLPAEDPRRLGNMFLAALWTCSAAACEQFFSELQAFANRVGFRPDIGYDFNRIGEVRYLKRHAVPIESAECGPR